MRVTVILSDDEYAQVKQRAGLVPLSRWFKSLAFAITEKQLRSSIKLLHDAIKPPVGGSEPPFTGTIVDDEGSATEIIKAMRDKSRNESLADPLPGFTSILEASAETPKPKKTCPHGKRKGYNCGLCGGLSNVE